MVKVAGGSECGKLRGRLRDAFQKRKDACAFRDSPRAYELRPSHWPSVQPPPFLPLTLSIYARCPAETSKWIKSSRSGSTYVSSRCR